jgi:transposase
VVWLAYLTSQEGVAQHAQHIRLGIQPIGHVHYYMPLRGQMTKERTREEILVQQVAGTAVQIHKSQPRWSHTRGRLPRVAERATVGVGKGPEGHIALPLWLGRRRQMPTPSALHHPVLLLGRDSLLPRHAKGLRKTGVRGPHPPHIANRSRGAEHCNEHSYSHYQILRLISLGKSTTEVMEATGYSRGWIQTLARRYNHRGPQALGDRRHQNPGAKERALLSADQQEELKEVLKKPPPDGGMWNSRKVGEWIERRSGRKVSHKKQRGWEYLKRLEQSPKAPRPHHASADKHEQEASKKALDEGYEAQGEIPYCQGRALV